MTADEPVEGRPVDRIAATWDLKDAAKRLGFELREEFDVCEPGVQMVGSWRFVVWDTVNEAWADV